MSVSVCVCEKFLQLLAVDRWFPPGTPVSSSRKLISLTSFHRLDMTLAVAEALNPNKTKPSQCVHLDGVVNRSPTCPADSGSFCVSHRPDVPRSLM